MNGGRCSASQFLLQYIKCVFFYRLWFFLPLRGERSCSEADVCARVWWPHEYVNSTSFSHFLPAVIPFPPRLCFSFIISLLNQPPSPPLRFLHFLFILFLLFFVFSLSSSSALPPLSIPSSFFLSLLPPPPSPRALLLASKVPWEPCGSSAGRHTNTTAATTGTSLFSLYPLRSLSLSLFSSSLFNVEVLSNCWLLLWLGGNGIFRKNASCCGFNPFLRPPQSLSLSLSLTHTHIHTHTHTGGGFSLFCAHI